MWLGDELRRHIDEYVAPGPSALVFTTGEGVPIRRGSFQKLFNWTKVVADLGFEGLHFHDLRHTGNMLAADSRVTTRGLMARMGHDSMHAALVYQHKSREADLSIAAHLDSKLRETLQGGQRKGSEEAEAGGDDASTATS